MDTVYLPTEAILPTEAEREAALKIVEILRPFSPTMRLVLIARAMSVLREKEAR